MTFIACLAVTNLSDTRDRAYRQGQIDALTGNVKFELREQVDKSVVWAAKPTTKEGR
jgi:hypothetical protein